MFSSIASFLPSALHIGPNDIQKPPQFSQDDPASEDDRDDLQGSPAKQPLDQPQAITRNREKSANENFIIVRPPPSKSNHPLNLQVQLVPPNVKPPNGVVTQSSASVQSAATDTDHTLARTSSLRSETSYTNYGSSTSSFSSVASSSGSTRRTIVPLYNLQAHNVMTNVIVDAGTDAKIAKFQRRGIILIDLASLEPVEVWGDSPSSAGRTSINLNTDDQQAAASRNSALSARSAAPSSRAHTPDIPATSSAISLKQVPSYPSYRHSSQPQPQPQYQPSHLTTTSLSPTHGTDSDSTPTLSTPTLPTSRSQPPVQTKRNIFGKLFQSGSSKKLASPTNLLSSSSVSPAFAISRSSQDSSPETPKASLQPQHGSVTPTSTEGGRSEKNHHRNISLTTFTTPIKTTFKNNKNRLTSAIPGSSSSSSLNANAPPDGQGLGLGITPAGAGEKNAPSPNTSALSLAATNESVDSGNITYTSATGYPLLQVPSHMPSSHSHQSSTVSTSTPTPQTQLQQLQSRAPVLGIQPTYVSSLGSNLSGLTDTKRIRALMYVWLVRKWLKRSPNHDEHGLPFSNVAARGGIFLGLGSRSKDEEHHVHSIEPGAGVEVRFEWKRGKVKGSGRGRTGKDKSETDGRQAQKRRSITTTTGEWDDAKNREDVHTEREKSRDSRRSVDKRLSSLSAKSNQSVKSGGGEADIKEIGERSQKRSLKRPKSAIVSGSEGGGVNGDDGEESDPEDSETPWVCTMKVRRTVPSSSPMGNGPFKQLSKTGVEKDVLKLKVGTLSPTPHHPKVVAMLKVPFPLPDIEIERLNIRRRTLAFIPGQGGVNELGEVRQTESSGRDPQLRSSGDDQYKGLELTAEEIKDIVCSTALWLIVREGTGGVGRISRKGDGWKLRS